MSVEARQRDPGGSRQSGRCHSPPVRWVVVAVAAAEAIGAATWYVGAYENSVPGFDWELAAVVLTGLGTTALALATVILAWVTRKDVATAQGIARASQETAQAAREANEIARSEIERRPMLGLVADEPRLHSQVETTPDGRREIPCVRLIVTNATGRRAAIRTRVLVDRYMRADGTPPMSAGSPSLGWPTAIDAQAASVTIFAGSGRPVNFGQLQRRPIPQDTHDGQKHGPWELHLNIEGAPPADLRQILRGPEHVVRLVVGADDGDAVTFDVRVTWDLAALDPDTALDSVRISISPVSEGSST